jgi:hypothetical protein
MRIRRDAAFASRVIFTAALLVLIPHSLRLASTWGQQYLPVIPDFYWTGNYLAPMGFAFLAIYLVGLIVIWSGYVQRERWAWFTMFVIVWVYAFPVFKLPVLRRLPISLSAWFWDAVKDIGPSRFYGRGTLAFLLMVVALLLPVNSFFRKRPNAETSLG